MMSPRTKTAVKLLAVRIMQALQAALQKLDRVKLLLLTTVQQVEAIKTQSQAILSIQAPQTKQKQINKKQALHNLILLKLLGKVSQVNGKE